MKFSPEDFLDTPSQEEAKPKKEKPPKKERVKKEKPPKKERVRKERPPKNEKTPPVSDETQPMDTEEITEAEQITEEEKERLSRKAITGIILIIVLGFILFSLGIRGIISTLALEDTSQYQPSETYDASYQEALEASEEDFEKVNAERLAANGETPEETDTEDTDVEEETASEEESGAIETENLENTMSKDDQIKLLQEEVARLTKEAEDARNDAALKEQQLTEAQSLLNATQSELDASQAREAQLQNDLNALAGGTK